MTELPPQTHLGTHRSPQPARQPSWINRNVVCLFGLPFDALSLEDAVSRLRAAAVSNTRCFVSTPNLNFVIAARQDAEFRDSVLRSDLSLADGAPLVWASRLLGLPVRERVAGASVFEALRRPSETPLTVYFFGGAPGVAAAACRKLNEVPGGLRCVGHDDPGFGSVEEMSSPARISRINDSGAQFVIVALGARKGQAWLTRNQNRLQAPLLCHLGAVVNFAAGTVRRAPPWWQQLGFEWLWRVKEEPALWRRYLKDGAVFARILMSDLPSLLRVRRLAARNAGTGTVTAELQPGGRMTIRVAGQLAPAVLESLGQALGEASELGRVVELVLAESTVVDASLAGLLLLAHGALGVARLRLAAVPDSIAQTLRHHGAGFLLEAPARGAAVG
jgi:N-acetylglucosaminyldiphosphoundecaprenol N-acetyl-beta-D-mannosaminyltransferase